MEIRSSKPRIFLMNLSFVYSSTLNKLLTCIYDSKLQNSNLLFIAFPSPWYNSPLLQQFWKVAVSAPQQILNTKNTRTRAKSPIYG